MQLGDARLGYGHRARRVALGLPFDVEELVDGPKSARQARYPRRDRRRAAVVTLLRGRLETVVRGLSEQGVRAKALFPAPPLKGASQRVDDDDLNVRPVRVVLGAPHAEQVQARLLGEVVSFDAVLIGDRARRALDVVVPEAQKGCLVVQRQRSGRGIPIGAWFGFSKRHGNLLVTAGGGCPRLASDLCHRPRFLEPGEG